MKPAFELRLATTADAAALSELATRTFKETYVTFEPEDLEAYTMTAYNIDQTRKDLEDPTRTTVLVFPADTPDRVPCGYMTLSDGSIRPGDDATSPRENYLEIKKCYVDKAFQGTGAASQLMARALEVTNATKRAVVWLGVWQQNHRAHRFYEKHGFKVTGTRTFQVGAVLHNDFIYTLQ